MKVTIVPIVIGALGTVTKGLLKGLENLEVGGRVETIQTTALLRMAWDESWRLEETCCHSNSREKPSANTDVKNSKGVNNNNTNGSPNLSQKTRLINNKKRTCRIVDFIVPADNRVQLKESAKEG